MGCLETVRLLKTLDLSSFDTKNVSQMWFLFRGCSSLRTVDVSSFDTSNVNGMSYMFGGCSSLVSVDVSGFDTSSVTSASSVFSGCSSLKRLDLSSFDMSAAQYMNSFFQGCASLQEVKFGDSFVFVGNYSFLPSQYSPDVPISWRNEKGQIFAASEVPPRTAGTYVCVNGRLNIVARSN